jgi:hypothetical protein
MRFDLSDLDRLTGFADALERLFWCLMVVGFFTAILGSAGTGLFVLILGAAAFVLRAGLEDFVRSRQGREEPVAPKRTEAPKKLVVTKTKATPKKAAAPKKASAAEPEPEFTVYRTSRRPRRKKSAL